jgi:hypothetical protein
MVALMGVAPTRAGELSVGYQYAGTPYYDGFKGNQEIRTNPSTVNGVGYVHPTQLDVGALGGDFIAIGTANGAGAPGETYSCADDYDSKWSIYVDWMFGGLYNCVTIAEDVYGKGANPSFEISWRYCPTQGGDRWVLFFDGTPRRCLYHSSHAGIVIDAGLETTGPSNQDRNIDVKYTGLQERLISGSAWYSYGQGSHDIAPSYTYQYAGSGAFNVYLAPLD